MRLPVPPSRQAAVHLNRTVKKVKEIKVKQHHGGESQVVYSVEPVFGRLFSLAILGLSSSSFSIALRR